MDRKTAIEWIEQIKNRIYGGDEVFDRQRKEALDMAIVDMKICDANNAGWISVKDRMPENLTSVLALRKDGEIYLLEYFDTSPTDECWIDDYSNCYTFDEITHWMPLPEPPKEET